jgi:hypothetical protein
VVYLPGVELHATAAGDLFISSQEAQVLSKEKPLYLLKGRFKTGQAATAVMATGDDWVEWSMKPDSAVTLRPTTPLSAVLPDQVLPLSTFLSKLEALGHVRVKVHKHKVEKAEGPGVTGYKISTLEPVALEPVVREQGEPSLASLAGFVDLSATKSSDLVQVVHRLEYDPKAKSINCGYPGVHLTKNIRIKAGQVIALVKVPPSGA